MLGGGKHVVGEAAGRRHAPVDADDQVELRPEVFEEVGAAAALAAQHVAADLEQDARRRLGIGPDGALPPATLDGLREVLIEGALHGRVAPVAVVPPFLVTAVVVPEE